MDPAATPAPTPPPAPRRSALFLAPALVQPLDAAGVAVLSRLVLAEVILVSWDGGDEALRAQGIAAAPLMLPPGATAAAPPSPRAYLATMRRDGIDPASSWLVTPAAALLDAAATAGIGNAVLVGIAAPPGESLMHLVQARSLADVPRVLIPRGGGCWHER